MGNLFFDEPGVKLVPRRPYRKGDVLRWEADTEIHYLVTSEPRVLNAGTPYEQTNMDILRITSDRPQIAPVGDRLPNWPIHKNARVLIVAENQEIPDHG